MLAEQPIQPNLQINDHNIANLIVHEIQQTVEQQALLENVDATLGSSN